MTQQKYSVGDKVLLRAKIFSIADSHETDKFGYEFDFENGYTIYGSKKDIYSITPEFEIGEDVNVRDHDTGPWRVRKFIGLNPFSQTKYIVTHQGLKMCNVCNAEALEGWTYIQKIKPKEPQVIDKKEEDITVIRDGKKYKLVEIE